MVCEQLDRGRYVVLQCCGANTMFSLTSFQRGM